MIIEGIADGLWKSREGSRADEVLVGKYFTEKEEEESTLLYNRTQKGNLYKTYLGFQGLTTLFNGDYSKKKLSGGVGITFGAKLSPYLNLSAGGAYQ